VNGGAGTPEWNTKDPQEILFDITDAIATIRDASGGKEIPNTIAIPEYQNSLLNQPLGIAAVTTIRKFLIDNIPELNGDMNSIVAVPILKGAGVAGKDRMVVYRRDPEKLAFGIPMDKLVDAPMRLDLGYKSTVRMLTAGCYIRYPLSVYFVDSI
jgi:hypothetical protein